MNYRATTLSLILCSMGAWCLAGVSAKQENHDSPLPGTSLLTWSEPLDVRMRLGINRFLDEKIKESPARRSRHWRRDLSGHEAYEKSVEGNRERLALCIGAVDTLAEPVMLGVRTLQPMIVAETNRYKISEVRWPSLLPTPDLTLTATTKQTDWPDLSGPHQIEGEGLLLEPKGKHRGYVVVLPDADQTPEQLAGLAPGVDLESQMARRLVENDFIVICPVLLSRDTCFSHAVRENRRTHRDWIYTPAFEVGRHPLGYEVQKVRAAVAWCRRVGGPQAKIAVAGYGEGGLVSLYAAALETQIDAVLVSGYWGPREDIWREPLYRNVWGLLDEFGDAEIATLIAPRKLLIEYSQGPVWKRNVPHTGPGELRTPGYKSVKDELERAEAMLKPGFGDRRLICGPESSLIKFGSQAAFQQLATALGIRSSMSLSKRLPEETRRNFDPNERQGRAVKQMENHTQLILRNSEYRRDMSIWPRLAFDSVSSYEQSAESLRYEFQYDHIGWLNNPLLRDMNPRSRKIYDTEKWIGYDVVLDVWPDVFAWGILCVPKNIGLGERRPVVVCQHGLEGVPSGVVEAEGFAARLAEQGFITFAPHNLYRGGDEFRLFQRKSNPLKASLFSIITPQHSQIINWLETLPFVDRDRIAFYGISYGGKSAMRIPAMERRYMLSICSADFNEWVRVNADIHFPKAYMYRGPEYEMPEWDLGHSFNYAEMTYLIAPRPFMVERGRRDKVGIDSWVAYEFARARRVYDALAIPDRCVIEYFDGPHQIHGVGTFDFLHHFLSWPQ